MEIPVIKYAEYNIIILSSVNIAFVYNGKNLLARWGWEIALVVASENRHRQQHLNKNNIHIRDNTSNKI